MKTVRTVADVRSVLAPLRAGSTIALVPTMGALHAGHVALFDAARGAGNVVVASIFINPTQFGDPADFSSYPRDESKDAEVAVAAGVDVFFAPSVDELYPRGFATWIDVEGQAVGLEGEFRPGHFRGVATVCAKLFAAVAPHVAFFGQKDAQQAVILQCMVRDLNFPVRLVVCPIVREADGLAMSSRNVYLDKERRAAATVVHRALLRVQALAFK